MPRLGDEQIAAIDAWLELARERRSNVVQMARADVEALITDLQEAREHGTYKYTKWVEDQWNQAISERETAERERDEAKARADQFGRELTGLTNIHERMLHDYHDMQDKLASAEMKLEESRRQLFTGRKGGRHAEDR